MPRTFLYLHLTHCLIKPRESASLAGKHHTSQKQTANVPPTRLTMYLSRGGHSHRISFANQTWTRRLCAITYRQWQSAHTATLWYGYENAQPAQGPTQSFRFVAAKDKSLFHKSCLTTESWIYCNAKHSITTSENTTQQWHSPSCDAIWTTLLPTVRRAHSLFALADKLYIDLDQSFQQTTKPLGSCKYIFTIPTCRPALEAISSKTHSASLGLKTLGHG